MRRQRMSILPSGMDGREQNGMRGKDDALQGWKQNATETLARSLDIRNDAHKSRRLWTDNPMRTVTPEQFEDTEDELAISTHVASGVSSAQASPRSIPGGEKPRDRRQGLVFRDTYSNDTLDVPSRSGPPVRFRSRPRTHTLDETSRHHSGSVSKSRHRVGSIHSTSSPHLEEPQLDITHSLGFPSVESHTLSKSDSVKRSGRRLIKKSSRPTSPFLAVNEVPFIDSLPFPITTGDANKILMLMKTLCGRMRGEVEYQTVQRGSWCKSICYIDDVKGSLMSEGDDRGPFHITVISDLRGYRVRPVTLIERQVKCLEVSNSNNREYIRLLPQVEAEFDLWLAALLAWQQVRSRALQATHSRPSLITTEEQRPSTERRGSSFTGAKEANIIKVAKLLLWDKGAPLSPAAIVRRPSTRDLRAPTRAWRRVSCILQDNGEFKLLTENDVTLLSVIQLSQLSRSAIQQLDKSVLGEEYCIAIFPQYTATSTQLSIFRPVYIALESRLLFEVWLCLLRAFSVPEIYGPASTLPDEAYDLPGGSQYPPSSKDMFRIEKSLTVKIVEAKLPTKHDAAQTGKHHLKPEQQDVPGDYLAEIILDGEVRARTMTKTETRNPFWREETEFLDLPSYLPRLSIVLKRIEHTQVVTHGFLSSSSIHIPDHPTEVIHGTVEIPVEKLERGIENEAWWPILDHKQDHVGEIYLKLKHDELVVLLAKDYQPLSELLHRFSSGLTLQLSQFIPSNLRKLSEILMNIYQVSGHSFYWLCALVEEEIDGVGKKDTSLKRLRWSTRIGSNESFGSASDRAETVRDMGKSLNSEANLLFRGNSLLTQALDFHMRRLGKEYLEDILGDKLRQIAAQNPDCEVDPSKVSRVEDFDKNWVSLIEYTTEIWNAIAGSANKCPAEIRQIMKYIRAVAEDRYGDFLRTVSYTSVSGFLFLRFFCPAVLNPKLFNMLPDHPQLKAQRTLTLVAKSLQALANLTTFGQKESWMEPMNKFLYNNRQGVKDFIDTICSIPTERNNFTLPASYSTPITILARLPPTSREGFPSLPYLIDHARNFAELVNLWLNTTAYLSPSNLDGDLSDFNDLCIELQRRTDECLSKAEQGEKSADQLSLQWEDLVDNVQATSLHDIHPLPTHIPEQPESEHNFQSQQWTEYHRPHPPQINNVINSLPLHYPIPPRSAGSDHGGMGASFSSSVKERKDRQQNFWELAFGKDSKYQRPYQPPPPPPPPASVEAELGTSLSSLPGRHEKGSRGFLGGLRRKGKTDASADNGGNEGGPLSPGFTPPGQWNPRDGGMI